MFFGLRGLFCQLCFAACGDLGQLGFVAGEHALVDEDIAHGLRGLGALADPVLDTLFFKLYRGWIGEGVVETENLKGFTPWITGFFAHDKAIRWLLFFAHAGQTNRQHGDEELRRIDDGCGPLTRSVSTTEHGPMVQNPRKIVNEA